MLEFAGKTAVITGGSSGIGQAIALEFARRGATIGLVGRDRDRLASVAALAGGTGVATAVFEADLAAATELERLSERILASLGGVDILVHAAGVHTLGSAAEIPPSELAYQYAVNTVAPYALTRSLSDSLTGRNGDVVFVNSRAGLVARAGVGAYAASKHALRAVADALRAELNPRGVRVLSVFPGRTATPMQREVFRREGRPYRPELLLQPEDIAATVIGALSLPRTAEVTDVMIRPFRMV